MSEPKRIFLRLLGLLLFLLGVAALFAILVEPGSRQIADWMGKNCQHTRHGPGEQCNVLDVLAVLGFTPVLILVGGVMALALRPPGKGPMTLDLSGAREP